MDVLPLDQRDLAIHAQRRTEQLMSRTERRQILASLLNQSAASLCFAKDSYGKPYLPDYPALQFSQSHCREQFLLAFNQQGIPIGVDIEAKRRIIANINGLAQRILTAAEMRAFEQAENPQAYL